MLVEVRTHAFDPYEELRRYQARLSGRKDIGATACFVGSMRDMNEGLHVSAMFLEHYPQMTEKYLQRIAEEARQRWPIADALIVHRVGEVTPGEPIVLVAVFAEHRAPAFDACRYLIEELKTRAPFWKKERHAAGTRWVERSTPR